MRHLALMYGAEFREHPNGWFIDAILCLDTWRDRPRPPAVSPASPPAEQRQHPASAAVPSGASLAHGEAWGTSAIAALIAEENQPAQTVQADQTRGIATNAVGPTYDDGRASPYSAASSDPFDGDPSPTEPDRPSAPAALVSSSTDDALADSAVDDTTADDAAAAGDDHEHETDGRAADVTEFQTGAVL